ncbi:hypothetical protein F3Y22_tig00111253pilonHSYRG00039 [Hibiscus syriacus]|uniref:Uncharacterized protein n=1 Tax=Hibiscus syriacus TaxID=106335 RepID=A0A6A2YTA6_HIBSY|nr:hypothetical protein F3Y22_tig00111253pilonHSYRG00039 [Hibiscus syriacus]
MVSIGSYQLGHDDSFVVKLDQSLGYDILRCESEIVGESKSVTLLPILVDLGLLLDLKTWIALLALSYALKSKLEMDVACGYDILHREVEIVDDSFVVKLNFELDILRREVEIVDGSFVVKLSFELDILCLDFFIGCFVVKLKSKGCIASCGHDFLHREVEIVDGSFVVKFSFELDIIRREVEIQGLHYCLWAQYPSSVALLLVGTISIVVKLKSKGYNVSSPISFAVKLKLTLIETGKLFAESNILRCEVEIDSE